MGVDPVTPVVIGTTVAAGGGTALLAGGSTAAAIAAANLAAASAASSAAALTATTTAATVGASAGAAGAAGFPAAGVGSGVSQFAPLLTQSSLGAAPGVSTSAVSASPIVPSPAAPITPPPAGGGFFKSAAAFLASPGGLALQAGLTGATTVAGGFARSREAKAAAEFSDFKARGAVLEGRRKALVELERVNKEQARQFAAIGASGILASGTATQSALETGRKGLANVGLIQTGAAIQGRAASIQAENLRRRGRVAILGGFVSGTSRAARLISLGNR